MSEILFIGGPADGQRLNVPTYQSEITIPWIPGVPSVFQGGQAKFQPEAIQNFDYRRICFKLPDVPDVFLYVPIEEDALPSMLVLGYRSPHLSPP